jgi:hypothetical protein
MSDEPEEQDQLDEYDPMTTRTAMTMTTLFQGRLDRYGDTVFLFHLAGGPGVIHHFMEHLSGPVATWWKDLGTITEFSPRVKQAIIEGVQEEAANRSVDELNRERDAMLLELLATRAKGEAAAKAAIAGGHGD